VLGATLRALESEHRQAAGEPDQRLQKRLKYLGSKRGGEQGDAQGESGGGGCSVAWAWEGRWRAISGSQELRRSLQHQLFIMFPLLTTPAGVFMGYTKYDRRKKHVRELDEQAARILAAKQQAQQGAGAQTDSEGGGAVIS
jgi:hypothetical protein